MSEAENKFLGFLISISDENGYFSYGKMLSESKYTDLQCNDLLLSLIQCGYVKKDSMEGARVTPQGKSAYISPKKKFIMSFLRNANNLIKFIATYVLGIISGLIIAYLTHKFGWN